MKKSLIFLSILTFSSIIFGSEHAQSVPGWHVANQSYYSLYSPKTMAKRAALCTLVGMINGAQGFGFLGGIYGCAVTKKSDGVLRFLPYFSSGLKFGAIAGGILAGTGAAVGLLMRNKYNDSKMKRSRALQNLNPEHVSFDFSDLSSFLSSPTFNNLIAGAKGAANKPGLIRLHYAESEQPVAEKQSGAENKTPKKDEKKEPASFVKNINYRDRFNGWTALHYAIYNGKLALIKKLLEHKTDLSLKVGLGTGEVVNYQRFAHIVCSKTKDHKIIHMINEIFELRKPLEEDLKRVQERLNGAIERNHYDSIQHERQDYDDTIIDREKVQLEYLEKMRKAEMIA